MRARLTHDYDSARRPPRAVEELLHLVENGHLLAAFIGRNLKVRYKRSAFGILWTLAQPAGLLIILSIIFSNVFAAHTRFYPAWLGPGLLLWFFFAQTSSVIIAEVAGGVDLWRRVRVPKTALAVATVCTGLINLTLATAPLVLIIALVGHPVGWPLLTLPLVALLAAIFCLGFALAVAAVALYFPDVTDLYSVALSAWMFLTPVIYPEEILPAAVRKFISLNPMTLYVESFRLPIFENQSASPAMFAAMLAVAAATLVIGWYVYTRTADELPYRG